MSLLNSSLDIADGTGKPKQGGMYIPKALVKSPKTTEKSGSMTPAQHQKVTEMKATAKSSVPNGAQQYFTGEP